MTNLKKIAVFRFSRVTKLDEIWRSVPHSAQISLAVPIQEPLKSSKIGLICMVVWLYTIVYADHDIWHGSVRHGPTCTCQIWPRLGRECGYRSP